MSLPNHHQDAGHDQPSLDEAIAQCAREPIHIPGSIQPHGYLLVVDEQFRILKASANCPDLLGLELNDILGSGLHRFICTDSISRLKEQIVSGALNTLRYSTLRLETGGDSIPCDAILHRSGSVMILEIEPHQKGLLAFEQQDFYQILMSFSVQLHKVQSSRELFEYLVTEVRRLTGYGHVMLYQFDPDWNGEVVAESRLPELPSYLGLNFPASDIPEQARRLYSINYLRLISDVNFEPVRILPDDRHDDGTPLDLSFSCLRSVSPVHLQYLRNMQVGASMSVSVLQNNRLWGLIVCHHQKPHHPAYPVRMVTESMAHTFSAFLSNFMQLEGNTQDQARERKFNDLSHAMSTDESTATAISEQHALIMELMNADGLIVQLEDQYLRFGVTPEGRLPKALIDWISRHCNDQVFYSDAIADTTGLEIYRHSRISGALVAPVTEAMNAYVMFFRGEKRMQKSWAGKPQKEITRSDHGIILTPRASFERWQQVVSGHSQPWTSDQIKRGIAISRLLLTKHYENSLRMATHTMDSVVNNSSALICIIDLEGHISQLNQIASDALGLDRTDVIGCHVSKVFDADYAQSLIDRMQQIVSQGESLSSSDTLIVNSCELHLLSVMFPLYNMENKIHAVCCISNDVSQLHVTQAALQSSNKELEKLAFVASHDLQEPIRLISMFTQLLKTDYADKLDSEAEQYIDFTLRAANRMRVLIRDLLEFSRLETAQEQFEQISTCSVIDELLAEFKLDGQLENTSISVQQDLPLIHMKQEHFACVMKNLISNALKYRRPEGRAKVDISCRDTGSCWQFAVADNGIGIKPEYMDRIFEIFQRLHTRDDYEGTGIGLALCTKIAEKCGGRCWAESTPGVGSTFYLSVMKQNELLKQTSGSTNVQADIS